ncbi:MAG: hypothetical protein A2Z29_02570 [Chloroflexi bacterium RBG_16_56_11]|nr:MAG: hypothetical protein A2Z29_02570 [Chloroflexi bacterium RBG_16_56_11]
MVATEALSSRDAEAIDYLRQAIASGRHWYLALLGAIGLWTSAEEVREERIYRYLIDGEAFDWLLLAERLIAAVDGLVPENERDALLFHGLPPLELSVVEVKGLIGERKYGQYLNYFYGVAVEEALLLAVQEEIEKERRVLGLRTRGDSAAEACQRLYESTREKLLKAFRQEKGYPQLKSIDLAGLKEFTYWLFKYRLKRCEKAKIASDTKKALKYLRRQWQKKGVSGLLAAEPPGGDTE